MEPTPTEKRFLEANNWGASFALMDACKELDRVNAELKVLQRDALKDHEAHELLKEVYAGALWESCQFKQHKDADPTWHCCDWSELVLKVAHLEGFELEGDQGG